MIKRIITTLQRSKQEKQSTTKYRYLPTSTITPTQEVEMRAFFTRSQR